MCREIRNIIHVHIIHYMITHKKQMSTLQLVLTWTVVFSWYNFLFIHTVGLDCVYRLTFISTHRISYIMHIAYNSCNTSKSALPDMYICTYKSQSMQLTGESMDISGNARLSVLQLTCNTSFKSLPKCISYCSVSLYYKGNHHDYTVLFDIPMLFIYVVYCSNDCVTIENVCCSIKQTRNQ